MRGLEKGDVVLRTSAGGVARTTLVASRRCRTRTTNAKCKKGQGVKRGDWVGLFGGVVCVATFCFEQSHWRKERKEGMLSLVDKNVQEGTPPLPPRFWPGARGQRARNRK